MGWPRAALPPCTPRRTGADGHVVRARPSAQSTTTACASPCVLQSLRSVPLTQFHETVEQWKREERKHDRGLVIGCILHLAFALYFFFFADPAVRERGYGYLMLGVFPLWFLWQTRSKRPRPSPQDAACGSVADRAHRGGRGRSRAGRSWQARDDRPGDLLRDRQRRRSARTSSQRMRISIEVASPALTTTLSISPFRFQSAAPASTRCPRAWSRASRRPSASAVPLRRVLS